MLPFKLRLYCRDNCRACFKDSQDLRHWREQHMRLARSAVIDSNKRIDRFKTQSAGQRAVP